jgi:enoyl-CoA hydratase/carnithine racemase
MMHEMLRIEHESGVATVTIDNPPLNVLNAELTRELASFTSRVASDEQIRVIVFKSADKDFFLSHSDVHLFLEPDSEASRYALDAFRELTRRFRTWGKVTIAQIEGRASGGGSEFLEAADMRFAALGRTFISHPEVSLGFIPCKGGSQRLPPLVGRARALELILGGAFIGAETAEAYGLINRAFAPAALGTFVKKLALRIASCPEQTVRYAKQCVNACIEEQPRGFELERRRFDEIIRTPETQRRLHAYYEHVGQDRENELRMGLKQSQLHEHRGKDDV